MADLWFAPALTHSAASLRALLDRYQIDPRRSLGQNFVGDANTVRRIARLAGVGPGDHVVEIGAGLGSLTLALAETGASVVAVEIDADLTAVLTELVDGLDVSVVNADAATLDWPALLGLVGNWHLVANLPYNVATPLVLDLLRDVPVIETMLVMVQREVGERLAAGPGDTSVGIPSMIVAYHGRARIVGRVPASVFVPRPNVESVLVRVERHERPPVAVPLAEIEPLVRKAFGQRRKMLRRSLAGTVTEGDFAAAGVDPTQRPQDLSIADWGRLADQLRRGS